MKNLSQILCLFLIFSFNQVSWGNNPFELDPNHSKVLSINCECNESDIQDLGKFLEENGIKIRSITYLDFSNSGMEDEKVISLSEEFLEKLPELVILVLKDYCIDIKLATDFSKFLKNNNIFGMSDLINDQIVNRGRSEALAIGLRKIERSSAKKISLEKGYILKNIFFPKELIIIGNPKIEREGIEVIVNALKERGISRLELRDNHIGDHEVENLVKALENNNSLVWISLEDNKIGDAGTVSIAELLKSNHTLTDVILDSNQIGDEGATALAKALESNTILKSLVLGRNQIGDKGATALAKALESNTILKSLVLIKNQIGDAGAKAFLKSLKSNRTLIFLGLLDNQMSISVAEEFSKICRKKKS